MSKLEPEYADAYTAWKADPQPKTLGPLLATTAPALNRAIAMHVGTPDPIVLGHARRLAAESFSRYDPAQSGLGTFLTHQLQGLKRIVRKSQNIISVPERVSLQRGHLLDAETTLTDALGREPTAEELADHTGLSVKRITHIRQYKPAIPEGFFSSMNVEEGGGLSPAVRHGYNPRIIDAVYQDLDDTDKKILEWTLGMHGTKPRQNQRIATALRVTPGAISQRKQAIQAKLDQMAELLPL